MKINKYALGLGLILAAILYRFIPHAPNFSPLNAIFLFAGATLVRKYASLLVILVLVYFSDFILNNTLLRGFFTEQTGIVWYSNYMLANLIAFVAIFGIGQWVTGQRKWLKIIGGSLLASVIFFLLTNGSAWYFDTLNLYADNFSGLIAAIAAGIPFFQHTVISDLLFSGVLFGSYYLANQFLTSNLTSQKA